MSTKVVEPVFDPLMRRVTRIADSRGQCLNLGLGLGVPLQDISFCQQLDAHLKKVYKINCVEEKRMSLSENP